LLRALDYIFDLGPPASEELFSVPVKGRARGRPVGTRRNERIEALEEKKTLALGRVARAGLEVS
jgi:hypothetical protein